MISVVERMCVDGQWVRCKTSDTHPFYGDSAVVLVAGHRCIMTYEQIEVMAGFSWFSIVGRIIEDHEFAREIEPAGIIITLAPYPIPTDTAGHSCPA